jgi:hypothetical protein
VNKKNKEAKAVWKAMRSHQNDIKLGFHITRERGGQGFCRNCESWTSRSAYRGNQWTLYVTDCEDCGKPTYEAKGYGQLGAVAPASERRAYLYGARAEAVRVETEALFAGKV